MQKIKFIKASDFCNKIFDGTHDTPKPTNIGYPLVLSKNISEGALNLHETYKISTKDFTKINKRSRVSQWDVLFSMIGTIGSTYIEKNYNLNYAIKNVGVFSAKNQDDAKFLYQYLKSDIAKRYIEQIMNGAVQKFFSLGMLKNFPIPDIEFSKRQKISKVLSTIDEKIELNNKVNVELEQMAQRIYEYWFLQFDFPNEKGKPYKSSGGKMVHNDILKREIPIEWEVKELKDILVNITDKSEKIKSENILNDGLFPVITQDKGELIKGYTNNKKPIKINPLLIFGDHSCTLKYVDFPFFRGADGTQILNFSNDKLTRYCYFSIQRFLPQIPNFGKYERHFKYLKAMRVVVPSIKVLNNFDGFAKSIFKKIEHNNIENYNLEKQRDYLLPMLMNGQINVDNIQVN